VVLLDDIVVAVVVVGRFAGDVEVAYDSPVTKITLVY